MKLNTTNKRKYWIYLFVLLFTWMAFTTEAMSKPKSAKTLIREAAAAYDKGNYDLALENFQSAYNIEPSASLIYNMGRVYERKGDIHSALNSYKQFVVVPEIDEDARRDAIERIEYLEKTIIIQNGGSIIQQNPIVAAPVQNTQGQVQANPTAGCININTASLQELTNLHNVAEKRAQKIIEDRNANGPFKSIEDITRINGIKMATVDSFRSQLCPIGPVGAKLPTNPVPVAQATQPAANSKQPAAPSKQSASGNPGTCIDINTGTIEDLVNLDGIAEKRAKDIIDDRNAKGPFKNIEDIARVSGIKMPTVNKFKHQLCPIGNQTVTAPSPENKESTPKPKVQEPPLITNINI